MLIMPSSTIAEDLLIADIVNGRCIVQGKFGLPVGTLLRGTLEKKNGKQVLVSSNNLKVDFLEKQLLFLNINEQQVVETTVALKDSVGTELYFVETFGTRDFPEAFFDPIDIIPKADIRLKSDPRGTVDGITFFIANDKSEIGMETIVDQTSKMVKIDTIVSGHQRLVGRFSQEWSSVLEGSFTMIGDNSNQECIISIQANDKQVDVKLAECEFISFNYFPLKDPSEDLGFGKTSKRIATRAFAERKTFRFFERLELVGTPIRMKREAVDDHEDAETTAVHPCFSFPVRFLQKIVVNVGE
jgi:hypothetical protein